MANFLGGAMRALSRSPKTAKFVDTLNHADLPRGWSDDPDIMRMAGDAWEELGTDSPFFRSFYRNSKLVDANGYPIVFYHGSPVEDLDFLDPDASRLVLEGGASYGVTHPGTGLSYLDMPEDRLREGFRERVQNALLAGHRLVAPDRFGNLRSVGLAGDVPSREFDAYMTFGNILRDLTRADWKRNLRDLSDVYDVMPPGVPVPDYVLSEAAYGHHAFSRFLEDNAEKIGVSDLRDVFVEPAMGKIYPVYVNAERPLVVESRPGVADWTQTGQMALDPSSLSPGERERLSVYPRNIRDFQRGYDTPEMLYPNVDFSDLPTDRLAAHLRLHTDHDALLSKGVHDGGGMDTPAADVVAFQRPGQAKAASGPVVGTFDPNQRSMFRGVLPYAVSGGALAAAMGAPSSASAAVPQAEWVPPSAKAELEGMEPPVWLDPVELISSFASAGGSTTFRTGQTALDAAQGWLADKIPAVPAVPEEYYEAAQ